jgi:glycosyltransferase involved in cell wall biosynthesis
MSVPVLYCGPISDASGYGEATRNAILALHEAGCDIKTQKVSFTGGVTYKTRGSKLAEELSTRDVDYKIKIIHTTPDTYYLYKEKNKYNIGHLFWETDKLPQGWVQGCNLLDEIWTGSEQQAKMITDSGVTVPVWYFPQAGEINIERLRSYTLPNFSGIVFYSIFDWNERKDPKTLINTFWKEFKGESNVCLLIHTHKGSYSADGTKELISEVKRWKQELGWNDTPRVFICTENLDEEGKTRLHRTGDCYVTTSRGEGWNIPLAEATAHRKPVISPKNGGITDYFTNKHYYRVEAEKIKINKVFNKYYEPDMFWLKVDEKSLRERFRQVYAYLSNEKSKTIPSIKSGFAHQVLKDFSYKKVGEEMKKRLEEIQNA